MRPPQVSSIRMPFDIAVQPGSRTLWAGRLGTGLIVGCLVLVAHGPVPATAAGPIASSSFVGTEDPLSENGAWAPLTSLSPNGGRFQKVDGAYPDRSAPDHAGARTTAVVPADQYSEIVVGHIGSSSDNVGPIVRVQSSGASVDSHYLWWGTELNGVTGVANGVNGLYRVDANGTSYTVTEIRTTSPIADGDRLRLIARGQVLYGIKNGARAFIYNTGPDATRYTTGTTGMLAFAGDGVPTNAKIASWSTDAAPASSGRWASSSFIGVENPLDEGDRWYPLPRYQGFQKAGGVASGLDSGHNASGVWSINAPPTQYSEVTLGTAASGGGGPIVRIDRNSPGQTGWLLFLYASGPSLSGIYKMTPDGGFNAVQLFTPTIVSGDKWRLTADMNTLTVSRNGVAQFSYTTDGSYATGDVGIEAYTPQFTLAGWEGGDVAGPPDITPPTAPSNLTATAASSSEVDLGWTASTDNVGVTGYQVERCQGSGCASFAPIGTTTGTTYSDTGLTASTTYAYRVRATDAAGNLSPYSNVATATTPDTTPPTAPSNLSATAASSTQLDLSWNAATDNVGVTGYQVERCQGSGCASFTQVGTTSDTKYSDTGLTASTTYAYRVRATDAAGNLGPYSNVASATTLPPPDPTPPTAPGALAAAGTGPTQVGLTWLASTDNVGVTGYLVEHCQGIACTSFTWIATVSGTSYTDSGLSPQTAYAYRVRATDAAGNLSPYSNVANAATLADTTPPTVPAGVVVSAVVGGQVKLIWLASTDDVGVTGYIVERCSGTGCTGFARVGVVADTSFADVGLTANATYRYRVRAKDAAGNLSSYSNEVTALLPLGL